MKSRDQRNSFLEDCQKIDAQEFQQAANYLLSHQFVSAYKHGQRKYFLLIEAYQNYFSNVFDALGMKLYVN